MLSSVTCLYLNFWQWISSGVTAACDSTVTVLLLSHVLPRFYLLFLFCFLKITTCIASYFLTIGKTFVSYLQTIGFMGWNFSSISLKPLVSSLETLVSLCWNFSFKQRKLAWNLLLKEGVRRGDSKSTVTVLSHAAVTPLLIHCQMFKYKHVTGDSNFLLFNSIVDY